MSHVTARHTNLQQADYQIVTKTIFLKRDKKGQYCRYFKVKNMLSQSKRPPFGGQNLSFYKAKRMLLKRNGGETGKNNLLTALKTPFPKNFIQCRFLHVKLKK